MLKHADRFTSATMDDAQTAVSVADCLISLGKNVSLRKIEFSDIISIMPTPDQRESRDNRLPSPPQNTSADSLSDAGDAHARVSNLFATSGASNEESSEKMQPFVKEIYDADGNFVCTLRGEQYERQGNEKYELRNLHIQSKNGEPKNLLKALGLTTVKSIYIHKNGTRGRNVHLEQNVILNSLDSVIDIGILLHELAHEAQDADLRMKKMKNLHYCDPVYNDVYVQLERSDLQLEECDSIFSFVPSAKEICLRDPVFAAYYETLGAELALLKKIGAEDECNASVSEEHKKQWRELSQKKRTLLRQTKTTNRIIRLPIQIIEWDANRRAFEWMKDLHRMFGIDVNVDGHDNEHKRINPKNILTAGVNEMYGSLEDMQSLGVDTELLMHRQES